MQDDSQGSVVKSRSSNHRSAGRKLDRLALTLTTR